MGRLDAVAGSGLADGRRQVVAHRPLGQEEAPGDVGNRRAVTGGVEDVALAGGEGFGAGTQRRCGEGWVDDPFALQDRADRDGGLVGGPILCEERRGARLHRPPEVAGPAECREDHGLARGQMAAELPGRPEAVHPGHLDVEQGDVGPYLEGLLEDIAARGHLRHDLEAGLEVEQGGERTARHALVLGQEDADHAGGSLATRRKPPSSAGPASRVPPARARRSERPGSPLPACGEGPGPRPSSRTSTPTSPSRRATLISQRPAPLWRTPFVTPSPTPQPTTPPTPAPSETALLP